MSGASLPVGLVWKVYPQAPLIKGVAIQPPGLGTPRAWNPRAGIRTPRAGNPQGWHPPGLGTPRAGKGRPRGPDEARGWILLDYWMILGSLFRVAKSPGGPRDPQRTPKFEDGAKVTAAGAEGDRQKYMTVGICRLFRFGVVLGRLWWMLGPFWDLFRYPF